MARNDFDACSELLDAFMTLCHVSRLFWPSVVAAAANPALVGTDRRSKSTAVDRRETLKRTAQIQ